MNIVVLFNISKKDICRQNNYMYIKKILHKLASSVLINNKIERICGNFYKIFLTNLYSLIVRKMK